MDSKMSVEVLKLTLLVVLGSLVLPTYGLKSRGTSFLLSFLNNESEDFQTDNLEIWVINDGVNSATVTISAPRDNNLVRPSCTGEKTVTLMPGTQHKYSVCWWAMIMPAIDKTVNDKVIRIDSTSEISVLGINKLPSSADSFLVLPMSSLGTSYYPVTAGDATKPNMVAIAATTDDTTVSVTLSTTRNAFPLSINHQCMVYENGATFTVRLYAHEVFYMSSMADFTGTEIMSSDPVAVFSGNVRSAVPSEERGRDHLVQQLISVGNWDYQYVYVPIATNPLKGELVKIISAFDGTLISIRPSSGSEYTLTLNAGEWMEDDWVDVTYLYAGKPFSVVVFTMSHPVPESPQEFVEPGMLVMPGINQKMAKYVIPALTSAQSTLNDQPAQPYTYNEIYVVALAQLVPGLLMDGQPQSFVCETVPGNAGADQGGYRSCRLTFDGSTAHEFTHEDGETFTAFVYLSSKRESLFHTLGLDGPSQCEVTVMRRGDKLDNDCDGSVDEEICDLVDQDGDSLVDEDCFRSSGEARGRQYVIAFTDNSKADSQPGQLDRLELYISPQITGANTTVTVQNPRGTFMTTRIAMTGMTTKIEIPTEMRLPPGSAKSDRCLLVEADEEIVMYALNKILFSSESYLAIPVDATGTEYFTVSTSIKDSGDVAEFAVCASGLGQTIVDITLANTEGLSVSYDGSNYGAGQQMQLTLEQYECVQIQSQSDLTGSKIEASDRVSVFSGNRRPIIGTGRARDHIVEQLPPVSTWGTEFYTNPVKRNGVLGSQRGDVFRIVTAYMNTVVTVSSTDPQSAVDGVYNLPDAGGFIELNVSSTQSCMFHASNPVLVVQLTKTQLNSSEAIDEGDPSMSLVVPKEAWTNDYRFVTPRSGQKDPQDDTVYLPYRSRMSIVIEKQFISKLRYGDETMLFRDAFQDALWIDIPETNPQISATTVDVEFGQNYVTAIDDTVFAATIYGAADREFYANPISLRLNPGMCTPTEMVIGDSVDNDCDDSIDEEVCNGLDDDRDGLIDEDCQEPPSGDAGRYYIVFMEHIVEYPLDYPLSIYTYPRCNEVTSVRMKTTSNKGPQSCDIIMMMEPGGVQQFRLPKQCRQEGTGMFEKTIVVESSCEIDIAAYNSDRFSNDGWLPVRDTKLGTYYRVITFYPVTIGTVMSVVATADTTVTVTTATHINDPASNPVVRHPVTNVTVNAGESFTVPLKQYESFQLISDGDLTGTDVVSFNSIRLAVFSGNVRVGISSRSRDHLVEQMPPWTAAATQWMVVANGMTTVEMVKAVCDVGTTITFPSPDSNGLDSSFSFTSNGETVLFEIPQFYAANVVAVGGSCMLALITKSQSSKHAVLEGDPTMSLIVPVNQYIESARFTIPNKQWKYNGDVYYATLVIVTQTSHTGSITVDGGAVSGWSVVDRTLGAYSVARHQVVKISDTESSVVTSNTGARFEARLWGVADRQSFAYPLGMDF